jgi:hypothetical protein
MMKMRFARWGGCIGLAVWLSVEALFAADVIINEIHYNPEGKTELVEYVELHNAGTSQVDLAGWYFSDGIAYTFPANTYLDTNEYVIVGQDIAAISNKYGVTAYGPYTPGILSNDGEQIELRNAAGDRMDRVDYQLGFPGRASAALRTGRCSC